MIDEQTVEHLSNLCKLEFSENEKTIIIEDLNNILCFVDKIKEVDTSSVEPLIYLSDRNNVLAGDSVSKDALKKEDALSNSPSDNSDFFVVPKIL
ncbi:MAG: Asp-tRNA(Asn)/Glu-tRNA(Gln) amidotransferase GatCAB subunit C [Bacteroidetes bacterium]|nr:MAG: Asp-tRNA(Asn)/Glu-tRNA(Gln) amidotransferase GatCAB subunit C [Bacteroidota bacterium]